jgi:predicted dehydrogenase
MTPTRLAVVGAGLIGCRHIQHIAAEPTATLAAIIDPAPATQALAKHHNTTWFPSLAAMLATARPDGVILATPNQLHVAGGLECIEAGLPVLVEKPIADDLAAATRLVEAAEHAGIPLLVGHHRRHNPLIQAAKSAIDAGHLGRIVTVHATCWFFKPDDYFAPDWRRAPGAGPILVNLIHDIDLLRHLCGEITTVQAMQSNAIRGNPIEETAVILLRFANGALGTINLSDTTVAPWSWEFTSNENPAYTHTPENTYHIGGTQAALALPSLDLWRHDNHPDWWQPLRRHRLEAPALDPLALQIQNLCAVIRGQAAPVVPGREGLATLRVIHAIQRAAGLGQAVSVEG